MRLRIQRKVVYATMGLMVLALIGGYSLASLTLGSAQTSTQQGSLTATVSGVGGLSANSTGLSLSAGSSNTTGCSATPGCNVTASGATVCSGSTHAGPWCAAGDFVEEVTLNTTPAHPFSGTVELTVYVTAGGTVYSGAPTYYTDASGNARESITLAFDIGSQATGPALVTAVTVIATASG